MKKSSAAAMPTFDRMMNPLLRALRELGGSGTIDEINQKVYELAKIPDELLEVPHGDAGGQREVDYRLAWSRTYLKKFGALENSGRGVWAIRPDFNADTVDPAHVVREVRARDAGDRQGGPSTAPPEVDSGPEKTAEALPDEVVHAWQEQLRKLLGRIDPGAFERLIQRLLREAGFSQVQVTGRSGDGGIDGKGLVKVNDFLGFHVLFQCKRYAGSVGPSEIRDFRGAMQGRADKGIFITTGTFTKAAQGEATRDGAPPIDLIDGELLIQKLEEYQLGLKTESVVVKKVTVDETWYSGL